MVTMTFVGPGAPSGLLDATTVGSGTAGGRISKGTCEDP